MSPKVASMNPENMVAGGLQDDFDALVSKVRLVEFDYGGKSEGKSVLAARVTYTPGPDEDFEEFDQMYSAGDIDAFKPSMDGETASEEGVFALAVGKRDQLNNNTNWATFIRKAIDAGVDVKKLSADVRSLEGIYGHFNRVKQDERKGLKVRDGESGREKTVLVLTELKPMPKNMKAEGGGKKKDAGSGSGSGGAEKESSGGGEKSATTDEALARKVQDILIGKLADAPDNTIPKAKLGGILVKELDGTERTDALKLVGDVKWLSHKDRSWTYDSDTASIKL